jgi:CSLREA domain-containing protein
VVDTLADEYITDGHCSLREAIAASKSNATIDTCPAGSSTEIDTITFNISGTIYPNSTLNLTDPIGPVVIDGKPKLGGDNIAIHGGSDHRIFYTRGSEEVTLRNLNINFGYDEYGNGGGLYNENAQLTLENCLFSFNNVDNYPSYGGAIYNEMGDVKILGCLFAFNNAYSGGGGIHNDGGDLSISNTDFQVNQANYGGGISNSGGTLTISNTELLSNDASYGGGLAVNTNGEDKISIHSSKFKYNDATVNGGGVYISYNPLVTITESTFSSNDALDSGGGIYFYSWATAHIESSDFFTNTAQYGGAISGKFLTYTTIRDSIFRYNEANYGGAIHTTDVFGVISGSEFESNEADNKGSCLYNTEKTIDRSNLRVENSTFTENDSLATGGAIVNITGTLAVENCTLVENNAINGNNLSNFYPGIFSAQNNIIVTSSVYNNCFGTITDLGHNLENKDSCGFLGITGSMVNKDPLLGPFQDNGGRTRTFALTIGSPAINNADPFGCPDTDQRGFPRRRNFCDIGAYEAQPASLTLLGGSGQSTQVLTDFPLPLSLKAVDTFGNTLGGAGIRFDGPASGAGISNSGGIATTGVDGIASLTATANGTPGGPYTVSASTSQVSTPFSLTNLASTQTTITSDTPDPSAMGQPFLIRFAVSSSGGVPTGDVTVSVSGHTEQCTGSLSNGVGSCSLAIDTSGYHSLVATYAGGGLFNTSSVIEYHTVSPPEGTIFLPLIQGRSSTHR